MRLISDTPGKVTLDDGEGNSGYSGKDCKILYKGGTTSEMDASLKESSYLIHELKYLKEVKNRENKMVPEFKNLPVSP